MTGGRALPIRLRLLAGRHRRLIAAGCAAVATASVIVAVRPADHDGVRVLAAAHDLAEGARVKARDVTQIVLPPAAVPAAAMRTSGPRVVGRRLAGPMRRGEAFTDAALRGSGPLTPVGPENVMTPVRLADPAVARLLRTGDVVDVLAAETLPPSPDGTSAGADGVDAESGSAPATEPEGGDVPAAAVVAAGVRVAAATGRRHEAGSEGGALVVFETTRAQATALAAAAANSRLSVTITRDGG